LRQPHDSVERRAQLVAHIGQELRLGPIGDFRRKLGLQQLILGLTALGHILQRNHHTGNGAGGVMKRGQAEFHGKLLAITAGQPGAQIVFLGIEISRQGFDKSRMPVGLRRFRRDPQDLLQRSADGFFRFPAGESGGGPVHQGNRGVSIGGHDGVMNAGQRGPQPLPLPLQLSMQTRFLGGVIDRALERVPGDGAFFQEIHCAGTHGGDRQTDVPVAGEQDDRQVRQHPVGIERVQDLLPVHVG